MMPELNCADCPNDPLEDATDEELLEATALINFSEEQCLTFIGELIEKLKVRFNKIYRLEGE